MTNVPENPADEDFEGFQYRVVLLGEAAVGKTSLLRRYTENIFDEDYKATIGTSFSTKDVEVTGSNGNSAAVRLVIWDMGGQATYKELRRQFMKGAAAAIIAYDVTRPETFMAMNNWFESFREVCPGSVTIIAANKVDLEEERMVPVEPGIMLRDWFQAQYYETSAKTGKAVTDVFVKVAELLFKQTKTEGNNP